MGSRVMVRRVRYDVLRVLAALTVLFYHFECSAYDIFLTAGTRGFFLDFLGTGHNLGSIAVEVFLLLAGILSVSTLSDSFSPRRYLSKRLMRLLVPFWISWLLVCAYTVITSSDLLWKNPKLFPLTMIGIDGWATVTFGLVDSFYLVGEWYLGVMVIITMLWPLLRVPFRNNPYVTCFILFIFELLAIFVPAQQEALRPLSVLPWSNIFSFSLGVLIAKRRAEVSGSRWWLVGGATMVLTGMIAPGLLRAADFENHLISVFRQMVGAGIILIVDGINVKHIDFEPAFEGVLRRLSTVFIWLSGLSMYFFMFQHVVEAKMVSRAATLCPESFDSFDYWGLAILTAVVTLLVSIAAEGLEEKIKSKCCSLEAPI